ncbi:MAG: lysophospholipid acyltransferase family protein [Armatimonadota bacterium]|nr:lysophospholipid acyltransferase family protein [Armatimonadota bacterium]MDR5703282.1 lysophospholipid acyltransferase family protein [Armatimonadota bacterium]MDR7435284.1 lysophospholipid acyltransferase family protein [Armatimonadota bacterium]
MWVWLYKALKPFVVVMAWLLFRLRVEGRENEPPRGPFIVISNHASILDPILLGCALRHPIRFMAKEELFHIRGLRTLITVLGAFPVRRGEPDRQAIRRALEIIKKGEVLGMFPGGTRTPDGRLHRVEPGAAALALRTRVPILPVAILGTERALPRGAKVPRLIPITIRIGPPLSLDGFHPGPEGPAQRPDHKMIERMGNLFIQAIGQLMERQPGESLEVYGR